MAMGDAAEEQAGLRARYCFFAVLLGFPASRDDEDDVGMHQTNGEDAVCGVSAPSAPRFLLFSLSGSHLSLSNPPDAPAGQRS